MVSEAVKAGHAAQRRSDFILGPMLLAAGVGLVALTVLGVYEAQGNGGRVVIAYGLILALICGGLFKIGRGIQSFFPQHATSLPAAPDPAVATADEAEAPRAAAQETPPTIAITVRTVRGRVVDPYRGNPDSEQPERFDPRVAEDQPFHAVVDALCRLPNVRCQVRGRRFALRRDGELLKIGFASAASSVSIDTAIFEGDPLLAIDALYALMPLFGAMELRTGTFVDLIDGSEPAAEISGRYRTHWIEAALERAVGRQPGAS